MNLHRLHRGRPGSPIADSIDDGRADASNDSQSVGCDAASQKPADVNNSLACKHGTWVCFSTKVDKPRLPLVLNIAREADPLQVLDVVVQLVAVDVVDCQPFGVTGNERQRDKPMKSFLDAPAMVKHSDFKISVVRAASGDVPFLERRRKRGGLPVSCSRERGRMRRGADPASGGYMPSQPLGLHSRPLLDMFAHMEIIAWQT